MKIANGNTYSVKGYLKAVGFVWNNESKRWEAENFNEEAWANKYCSASWNGRREAKNCNAITFEEV